MLIPVDQSVYGALYQLSLYKQGGIMTKHYDNFIGGRFVLSSSKDRIEVTNPCTGEVICTVPESSPSEVVAAVSAAETAQREWRKRPAIERAKGLRALAERIRRNTDPIARVITEEQGKILSLARAEVASTADDMDYMAEWARRRKCETYSQNRTSGQKTYPSGGRFGLCLQEIKLLPDTTERIPPMWPAAAQKTHASSVPAVQTRGDLKNTRGGNHAETTIHARFIARTYGSIEWSAAQFTTRHGFFL